MKVETKDVNPQPLAAFEQAELALVVIDIVGSTPLLRAIGPQRYAHVLLDFRTMVRDHVASTGGSEVTHTGDGFFLTYPTSSLAVAGTAAVQRSNVACNRRRDHAVAIRAAVHVGTILLCSCDLIGLAVHDTFELGENAESGKVWVSAEAANQIEEIDLKQHLGGGQLVRLPKSGWREIHDYRWAEIDAVSS